MPTKEGWIRWIKQERERVTASLASIGYRPTFVENSPQIKHIEIIQEHTNGQIN